MDEQAVRAFPIAVNQVEQAILVGVQRGDSAHVLRRVVQAEFARQFLKRAVAAIAEEKIRPAFIPGEDIHAIRHQRQRQGAASTRDEIEAGSSGGIIEVAVFIDFVKPHWPAVIGDVEAVTTAALPVNDRDRTSRRQVEYMLVAFERE